jgi:UDP-N-acetylmuramate dehydrogenase
VQELRGLLKFNEPLFPYTSWRVGGPADKYYRPFDTVDLGAFLATLSPEESVTWLGLGSNVLIHDAGIRGVVIHTLAKTSGDNIPVNGFVNDTANEVACSQMNTLCEVAPQNNTHYKVVCAGAGVPCAKLAKFCIKLGLVGGEFFAGIPGTIGGALAMNAGAFGGETWQHCVLVEVMNRQGERLLRLPAQYQVGYRSVVGPKEEWFMAGHFQFERGDPSRATVKVKELLSQRNESQPIGTFSCGSVFKNPEGDYAARLIEQSKLKGFRIGDAEVSFKHANFILNRGQARSSDILQLMEHIQEVVFKDHQIQLQPEVRFLGF